MLQRITTDPVLSAAADIREVTEKGADIINED
jgi:hypothetical protein